ncbi:hypothetical protein RYX36_009521 [Vicia faba]
MPPRRIYTSLANILFSNIHLTDGILQSKVRKHRINLSVEEFGEMLNLPHENIVIEPEDNANRFNYITVSSSLMKEPSSNIPYSFVVGYIHPGSRITRYVINHIFFSRRDNFDLLTKVDVETIWLIENKVKINWVQHAIGHMIENK